MMTKAGATYVVGTVFAGEGEITYYNNVIKFVDWIKEQMIEEEDRRTSTRNWGSRSHETWIARQAQEKNKLLFSSFYLAEDIIEFGGRCIDFQTGVEALMKSFVKKETRQECLEHCKNSGKIEPITACQYSKVSKECRLINRQTFYGDGSDNSDCFVFHRKNTGIYTKN